MESNQMSNIDEQLMAVKKAAKSLRTETLSKRNAVLLTLAKLLVDEEDKIFAANAMDVKELHSDVIPAFRDRLIVNYERLKGIRLGLEQVAALPDPLGEIIDERFLHNGLLTKKIRSPLGIIFMIFESRPNVAIEAFSLAFKAGNAIVLRGGKESKNTVHVFYELIQTALRREGVDINCALGITNQDHALVRELLQKKRLIDVVVPRGGDKLIDFVVENSKIPIIKNDRGMCHIYVHRDADEDMVLSVLENAKKQRPGVCNAAETLLIHEAIAGKLLPKIYARLSNTPNPVEWYGCEKSKAILGNEKHVRAASSASFDTEYLDYKMNCKIVQNENEAIDHIELHGSKHSEAILTQDEVAAKKFQAEVDAAAVYWNASTRFTDGFELGLGGELGISTQKLHVRGPVGLRELTSVRWIIEGNGQIRT